MLVALLSRLLSLVWSVIADWILPDHAAQGVEPLSVVYSSQWSQLLLSPFVKWDAVHYVKLASEGYTAEHQLAFFPLYPLLIKLASVIVAQTTVGTSMSQLETIIIGPILLNIVAFVAAALILKRLLPRLTSVTSGSTLDLALLMFMVNPAGVFFSAVYTESIFALLSQCGFYLYASNYDCISAVPFVLASLLRSNGSLNVVVVLLTWLQRTKKHDIWTYLKLLVVCVAIIGPAVALNMLHLHLLCGSAVTSLYTSPMMSGILDATIEMIRIVMPVGPFITDADTVRFCTDSAYSVLPPVVYSYLQAKYWNVGFLRHYQLKQIPNFLLALPITYVACYTLAYSHRIFGHERQAEKLQAAWRNMLLFRTALSVMEYVKLQLQRPEMPYLVHLAVLLVVGTLFAHVQITTRLICAASPIIYVGMANMVMQSGHRWMYLYVGLYNIVGILLHCNYYPWT